MLVFEGTSVMSPSVYYIVLASTSFIQSNWVSCWKKQQPTMISETCFVEISNIRTSGPNRFGHTINPHGQTVFVTQYPHTHLHKTFLCFMLMPIVLINIRRENTENIIGFVITLNCQCFQSSKGCCTIPLYLILILMWTALAFATNRILDSTAGLSHLPESRIFHD